MKRWPIRGWYLLGAGAAALALALPAAGQRERTPESLLPPGFGDPPPPAQPAPPPPPPPPSSGPSATPAQPGSPAPAAPSPAVPQIAPGAPLIGNAAEQDLAALAAQAPPPPIEIPDS